MKEGWQWQFSPWQSNCIKNTIFCKNSYIFIKNVRTGNIFVVNPSPKYFNANIYKNKGATKKASKKFIHDKVFNLLAKRPFFTPKWW